MDRTIAFLESWLEQRANDDWEHQYGVTIESLDNPGWCVSVNLIGTPLETRPFNDVTIDKGPNDWLTCRIRDRRFEAFGDPKKLARMLEEFANWASGE